MRRSRNGRRGRQRNAAPWEAALIVLGTALLSVSGIHAMERRHFQGEARSILADRQARGVGAHAPAPRDRALPDPPPRPDEPIGLIEIPRLGLSAVIVEGTSDQSLRHAVGHLEGTALPGGSGTTALAAHRDGFFRPLRELAVADTVTLRAGGRVLDYRVDSLLVVDPGNRSALTPPAGADSASRLVLVTCYPFQYIGPAPQRFVVIASPLPGAARGTLPPMTANDSPIESR